MNSLNDDEIEIDLLELAKELLSHWKMILSSTVLLGAIAMVYCVFLVTPLYSSTAQLYVLTKSTSLTSLADLQIGSNLSADYKVVISGRPVLEQVIKNLNLENETYSSLGGRVSISTSSDRIIEITVTDKDREQAKRIVDEMATVSAAYISQKMDQDPPNIITYGYSDQAPVSPRTKRTTAMAAMAGFALASMLVIVSFLLNDTIMTPEDVEKKLKLNVLGQLPMEGAEYDGSKKARKKEKRIAKKEKKAKK